MMTFDAICATISTSQKVMIAPPWKEIVQKIHVSYAILKTYNSFPHNPDLLVKNDNCIVICKYVPFGRVQNFVVWYRELNVT